MMGRVYMEKVITRRRLKACNGSFPRDKELVSETLEMLQSCYQHLGKNDEWAEFYVGPLRKILVPPPN